MAGVSTGTGFAANVGSNVLSVLWNKIVQVVKMVRDLPTAVRDMDGQVERLNNLIHGINAELNREQRPPQRIVKAWLDKADDAILSSRSIGRDYEQHRNCLGCCPNCLCRYRISKDIRAWNLIVDRLHSEKRSDFSPIGEYGDPTPPAQIPSQLPECAGNGIQVAQSQLERWLTDKDIRRIGIHGMGGVGKSLLLDTINDSQNIRSSFELIIKVTVSKNHILDLQDCVADRLKLREFPNKSNFEGRKDILRSSLKDKKFIILLDDMWADGALWRIDELQNLGVSLNDTGFKIVLTTRDKEVCARMNVQKTITVEPLLEEEGWQLFRSRAFQNRDGDVPQEIEEVARKIAKECKGLPLAIIVVAAAMTHHTDLQEWEVALDQMQNFPATFYDLHTVVDKELFQRLKWSYDALPDALKTCFLCFAAYPEDREIMCTEVIDMWIADSLVKGNPESYLQDTGHNYINQLGYRCLIEVVQTDAVGRIETVKMHDILRDLAILIAEKEQSCYFKAGQGVSHFPVQEEVDGKGWARLSLMYNRLDSLPTTFPCSSLSVLLLGENLGIKEVPGSFLRELPSLKVLDLSDTGITSLPQVLDLSDTGITSLPPSIGDLKHLASLQLRRTGIRELPDTIGDLNNLQFLDLSECNQLRCLPERISDLKRLRALNICNTWGCLPERIRDRKRLRALDICNTLSQLPRGMSELVSLERLDMSNSRISLHFEEDANVERKYACLKDMQSLSCLRFLKVRMKSPVKEGVIGNWSKMRYLYLLFDNDVNQDYLPQDMRAMKDLECFRLEGCNVERLPSWVSEFRRLSYLSVSLCRQLRELELGMGFPKLQTLMLSYLESLECVGAVAPRASGGLGDGASPLPPMLKSLHVTECNRFHRLRGEWDKLKCLERIRGYDEWWNAIEWEDPNMRTSLESKYERRPRVVASLLGRRNRC